MATSPEPGQGLGVFCVINGDENRCRPDAVRKFFLDEVGSCRIVTSSRSYSNEKTFLTLEFTSRQNAQFAMSKTGCKVNGCRISASPFRSRRLGNLLGGQDGNMMGHFNNRGGFQHFGRGNFRGNFNQRGGGFQPFMKRGRSWGEQESEKVRGMSPRTAAKYIENRIRQKEERTQQRQGKASSYSRSRSRSRSRSLSGSPYRRSYSRHSSDNASRSRSRSRSPRRKTARSHSGSRSSTDSYRRRHRHGRSGGDTDSEERQSKDRRRRHKKRKHRSRADSSSERNNDDDDNDNTGGGGSLSREVENWAAHDVDDPHIDLGVDAAAIIPSGEVAIVDEVGAEDPAAASSLPALPSTQLALAIPSTLSLQLQQEALQRRHGMQQEFEADVSTISSVSEMLLRHDQSIGVQLRNALQSVVNEVTAKYTTEFDDYLKTVLPKST